LSHACNSREAVLRVCFEFNFVVCCFKGHFSETN
jgi:hypothetical protein